MSVPSHQIQQADCSEMWHLDKHLLTVGDSGSGKTSFLFYFSRQSVEMGNTVIIRDIGDHFEYMALCKEENRFGLKVYGFIPNGCELKWRGKGFRPVYYDPGRMEETLFEKLVPARFNIIFADRFMEETEDLSRAKIAMRFWSRFFVKMKLWKDKPGKGRKPFVFVFDQFNDIGPGRAAYTFPKQEHLVNAIAGILKDFRRSRIRFVGSTHTYDDLSSRLRSRFPVHVIKRNYSTPTSLPSRLANYANLLANIQLDECWFKDSNNHFQQHVETPLWIPPCQYYDVVTTGNMNKFFSSTVKKLRWTPEEAAEEMLKRPDDFMNDKGEIDYKLVIGSFDLPVTKAYGAKALVEKALRLDKEEDEDTDEKTVLT